MGLIGDTSEINIDSIDANDIVQKVMWVQEPFKRANIMFHPEPTIIKVGDKTMGGGKIAVIAGPCSVESEEQIVEIAKSVKKSGAAFLRGGAYKPKTSPYSFQGLGLEGLRLLKTAKEKPGQPKE